MSYVNFAVQLMVDPWRKIDFDSVAPQTGITNMEEYNTVSVSVEFLTRLTQKLRFPKASTLILPSHSQNDPPEYDFAAIQVPFSLYFVRNDKFNGPQSTQETIDLLHARDKVKIIDRNELSHNDIVLATDARCYIYDDVLSKFNALESTRDGAHRDFRSKVDSRLTELPFEDGCVGKTN